MTKEALSYFISYKRDCDDEFANRLATELKAAGIDVWMDRQDILVGQNWDEKVQAALHTCSGLILILTPESVASKNVMDEVSFALDKGKRVIPVLLRACECSYRLTRLQRADFTVTYERGLVELLKAVKGDSHVPQLQPVPTEAVRTEEPIAARTEVASSTVEVRVGYKPSVFVLAGALLGAAISVTWLSLFAYYDVEKPDHGFWTLFLSVDAMAGAIAGRMAARETLFSSRDMTGIARRNMLPARLALFVAFGAFILGLVCFLIGQPFGLGYWSLLGIIAWSIGIPLGAVLGAWCGIKIAHHKGNRLPPLGEHL